MTDTLTDRDPDANVVVIVAGSPGASQAAEPDLIRSLRSWLADEEELRGSVSDLDTPPRAGELGPWLDGLAIVLAPGGAAAVLAGAVLSWIRWNRSDLRVTLRRSSGEQLEVEVKRLRGLDTAELPAVVDHLRLWLELDPTRQNGEGRRLGGTAIEPGVDTPS